jgi:hypothetical protein
VTIEDMLRDYEICRALEQIIAEKTLRDEREIGRHLQSVDPQLQAVARDLRTGRDQLTPAQFRHWTRTVWDMDSETVKDFISYSGPGQSGKLTLRMIEYMLKVYDQRIKELEEKCVT